MLQVCRAAAARQCVSPPAVQGPAGGGSPQWRV